MKAIYSNDTIIYFYFTKRCKFAKEIIFIFNDIHILGKLFLNSLNKIILIFIILKFYKSAIWFVYLLSFFWKKE